MSADARPASPPEAHSSAGLLPKAPPGRAPLRGTQSFVGVMSAVWKRPLLTGAEVLQRWLAGAIALGWLWRHFGAVLWPQGSAAGLAPAITPAELAGLFADRNLWTAAALWLLLWSAAAALGRSLLLRRLEPTLHPRRFGLFALTLLRVAAFSAIVLAWAEALLRLADRAQIGAVPLGTNPNVVVAFAEAVGLTLVLFVVWSLVSWVVRLAVIISAAEGKGALSSLRACFRHPVLRSKLIEINLVMGIVKVALLVLAMVLSACPLPFQSVASESFLTNWWIATSVLYLLASDYFHVVRLASYTALYDALKHRD